STSQDASNFGDSFWLLDPSLPTIRLLFLSPSSILLYVKVVYSVISLATFVLEFFLRLTLQLPSRKSGTSICAESRCFNFEVEVAEVRQKRHVFG
ncbi:unnamed protein product, partial [Brassica oleracea]